MHSKINCQYVPKSKLQDQICEVEHDIAEGSYYVTGKGGNSLIRCTSPG